MPTFRPDVDICDCGALVLIVADVPGAAPDAIDVSFDDGVLSVAPGSSTTYTLTVSNVGGAPATGVSIVDTLPPGTTFTSVGGAGCSDGGTISGSRRIDIAGTIAAGATVTCTLTIGIDDPVPAGTVAYQNLATVTDDGTHGTDPTPDNNTNSDTDELTGRAPDLRVTKNDALRTVVFPGSVFQFFDTFPNAGSLRRKRQQTGSPIRLS